MNPYFRQGTPNQELGGLQPVFQNAAQQQMNQQAALAQQNQLVSQAGASQGGGGMNPLAMAQMLRKKEPKELAPVIDKSKMMSDTPQYADPAYMQAGY